RGRRLARARARRSAARPRAGALTRHWPRAGPTPGPGVTTSGYDGPRCACSATPRGAAVRPAPGPRLGDRSDGRVLTASRTPPSLFVIWTYWASDVRRGGRILTRERRSAHDRVRHGWLEGHHRRRVHAGERAPARA